MGFAGITSDAFGDLPPVGHVLRSAISDRWLPVHSLPHSKRYAETKVEYDELLRRHNELAVEVLGADELAVLFLHAWGNAADFGSTFSEFGWAAQLELTRTAPTVYPGPGMDEPNLLVAGFSIRWSPRAWDCLLRDIADDRLPSVVLVSPVTGEAYTPYDGGADLFLSTSERVATLATRWASWLSTRPDGL